MAEDFWHKKRMAAWREGNRRAAILALPEARRRPDLANALAEQTDLPVAKVRRILAEAPDLLRPSNGNAAERQR